MNITNLTSGPAVLVRSLLNHQRRLRKRLLHPGRNFGLRLFSLFLLLSMVLSPAGTFTVDAAPAAPVLIGPANGSTQTVNEAPPIGIPQFEWQPVDGATSYRIQIASTSGFNSPILDITTKNTRYTPKSATNFTDGLWWWHVKVNAPAGGDWSEQWSFTKQWASPGNAPILISPAVDTSVDFYDSPLFSWNPVTGAARYKLQIYTSPGGWSTLATPLITTVTTTVQPKDKLADGVYYWRVIPVDIAAHDGTPSAERRFTADYHPGLTLLDPDPDTFTTPVFTPTFRWTAVRGAQFYRLQYATDDAFSANLVTVDTPNTTYTPISTLPNDQNYWWRVRAFSGNSVGDWVQSTQPFQKRWYIKPVLLTPRDSYTDVRFPLFSWTPVPGAAYYIVELDYDSSFAQPIYLTSEKTTNTFYTPKNYTGGNNKWYWRVTPYDGNDKKGSSSVTGSFWSYYYSVAPELVSPLYYYPPDIYAGFPDVHMFPYEDRTIPLPIFTWHRVLKPADDLDEGDEFAEEYEVQVSTDATFTGVDWGDTVHNWRVITENTTATPSAANPFTPLTGTDYFWRVRCRVDDIAASPWSQVWKTRFDPSKQIAATSGAAPQLLRPTNGYEFAEATPLLEWFPKTGAATYEVQISLDAGFSTYDTATVTNAAYIPTTSLGRRTLGDTDFNVYYWRVRQTGGSWSEVRRFQVAAQSRWAEFRTLGELVNPSLLATDPMVGSGDVTTDADYDLTTLYAVQTKTYWHFGFNVPIAPAKNVTYAIYLDMDGATDSGGTTDPRGYTLTATSSHLPEVAIYILQESGAFTASKVYIYHWNSGGAVWNAPQTLQSLGGVLSKTGSYVEIKGSNSIIGYNPVSFDPWLPSYYLSLLSLPAGDTGKPQDSVPTDPKVPSGGTEAITKFASLLIRNPYQIGSDPEVGSGDVTTDTDYDLTDLQVGESKDYWFFGFHVPVNPGKNVTYALYLDMDHVEGSGGTTDPRGYTLSTISAYRPEYVIYILQQSGSFSASTTFIYHWEGTAWGTPLVLGEYGGSLGQYTNPANNYVELKVSNTSIGQDVITGSYTATLVSLPAGNSGTPKDSVPSDPNVPGSGPISRFVSVTERMNLLRPATNIGSEVTYPSILPIFFDYPILTPYSGFIATFYRDPGFTTEVGTYDHKVTDSAYWAQPSQFWPKDFVGSTTYYWRVRPHYLPGAPLAGVWSQGSRLERLGFKPQDLNVSVTFATPTFSWKIVEGAMSYDLQVATDAGFGSPIVNITNTKQNSYTPVDTLPNGVYYWRVRARRYSSIYNDWTVPDPACPAAGHTGCFTLSLPAPSGLVYSPPGVVGRAPTFCWTPLIINVPAGQPFAGSPFFATWKYRVQVSTDANFSAIYDNVDTEQSCWTPTKGYPDRDIYYWRVGAIDGNNRLGNFSAYQTFSKQYPVTTLVSPANGANILGAPTFVWTPVNGAAKYKLDVSHYANFSGMVETVTTDNTSWTPTILYASNPPLFYWRVAIIDYNSNIGPYTNATLIYDPYPYDVFLPVTVK